MLLPLLKLIWLVLLPCCDVVTTVRDYLADVIANVVAVVIATLFDFVADVVPLLVYH